MLPGEIEKVTLFLIYLESVERPKLSDSSKVAGEKNAEGSFKSARTYMTFVGKKGKVA